MTEKARQITYSALMCTMIIVSTLWLKFSIPGTDVLFTTQVFFILLCGQLLSPRYCFFAIFTYIAIGLVGVPVFSAAQGLAVITTPSFGYLLSFPFAAAAVSKARDWLGKQKGTRIIASLIGIVVIDLIALSYIAALKSLYFSAPIPFATLFSSYCLAFLPLDIIKGVFAALIGARLEKPLRFERRVKAQGADQSPDA